MGISKPTWDDAKKMLGDPRLLQNLEQYDKDHISDSVLSKLKKYTSLAEFKPEAVEKVRARCSYAVAPIELTMSKVSKAAKSLCMWVRAIEQYAYVYREVEPKRKALAQAEKKLAEATKALEKKRGQLAEIEAKIQQLQETYNESLARWGLLSFNGCDRC